MRNANLIKLALRFYLLLLTLVMLAIVLAFTQGAFAAHPTPSDEWQWLKLKTEVVVPPVTPPPVVKQPAPVVPRVLAPRVVKPAAKPAVRRGYPTRPASTWWSGCSGWRHLTTGEHAGKFDAAWLQTLTHAEVQSLHSDTHEGRVKSQYVVRPVAAPRATVRRQAAPASSCPGGVCPVNQPSRSGRRLFDGSGIF